MEDNYRITKLIVTRVTVENNYHITKLIVPRVTMENNYHITKLIIIPNYRDSIEKF